VKITTPALSIYLMAGDDTAELAEAAVRGGATAFEIGIPYSDPLADGPTVQRAGQRALAQGMTTRRAIEVLREVRARVDVPLVPMTYAAPVMAYGEAAFCADAAAAGADGVIVPDVPPDESGPLLEHCREAGLALIPLLAPTSLDARIELACRNAGGFVYLWLRGNRGLRMLAVAAVWAGTLVLVSGLVVLPPSNPLARLDFFDLDGRLVVDDALVAHSLDLVAFST